MVHHRQDPGGPDQRFGEHHSLSKRTSHAGLLPSTTNGSVSCIVLCFLGNPQGSKDSIQSTKFPVNRAGFSPLFSQLVVVFWATESHSPDSFADGSSNHTA